MFMQLLIGGISMGFVYALVAIEYTLIWNACGLLNFAHGQMIVIGAYIFGGSLVVGLGASYVMGWIGTVAIAMILGIILAFVVFIPLKDLGSLYAIIATMMFGMILINSVTLIWGNYPFYLEGYFSGVYRIGNIAITKSYVFIILISAIVVSALLCFMRFTKIGRAMRCVTENKSMSAMVGINVRVNMIITIAISCVICAVVGMLVVPLLGITTTMGDTISTKGFIAAVFGGFGSVPGAVLGGVLVGVIENIATIFIDSVYKDITSFVILIVVIMFKPAGLLGLGKVKMTGKKPVEKKDKGEE